MTFEPGDRFETHSLAQAALFDYFEVFYNRERASAESAAGPPVESIRSFLFAADRRGVP